VGDSPDVETLHVDSLILGHRAIEEHTELQKLIEAEPGLLLPTLTVETSHLLSQIREFFVSRLALHGLPAGVSVEEAADYVARMLLSFMGSPGRWDLSDRLQVTTLVRSELIAGVVG